MLSATPISPMPMTAEGVGLYTLAGEPGSGWLVRGLDFAPRPGVITVLEETIEGLGSAILDTMSGLRRPDAGVVSVAGVAWGELSATEANTIRGTINWAFRTPVWIESISLAEGITLEERYHTGRASEAVEADAAALCRWFGLPGLPMSLPIESTADDLRRAELARAFLGDPIAVFLESPLGGAPGDVVPSTIEAMQQAASRGAAVVYTTPVGGEPRLSSLLASSASTTRLKLTPEGVTPIDALGGVAL